MWFFIIPAIILLWFILEIGIRLYVGLPLKTDFYGSLPRESVHERQQQCGLKIVNGPGWVHLGWIADPQNETYRVEHFQNGVWVAAGRAHYGSFLWRGPGGLFRVWAAPRNQAERLLGEVEGVPQETAPAPSLPAIASDWQPFFKPVHSGSYINDHALFQDAAGAWRLIGITSKTDGDFNQEKYFASASSDKFPPERVMTENEPVADLAELAWAPHVIRQDGTYYLFWSPHRLMRMESPDGVTWHNPSLVMAYPYHKCFRDAFIIQVAEGQWLLYATGRGRFFSRVDIYQSFNLKEWQYIRPALSATWGSERNSPFASMESPSVFNRNGRWYLSITYNNDTFFWHGILLLFKKWLNPGSYNDTLLFHSDTPYDFGIYRGARRTPQLLARLAAHAPRYIFHPERQCWYITTAGWPWVAQLTAGEVSCALLEWGK